MNGECASSLERCAGQNSEKWGEAIAVVDLTNECPPAERHKTQETN